MKRRPDGRFQKRITLPNGRSKLLYSTAKSEREAVKDFNRQMLELEMERIRSMNFDRVAEAWAAERFESVAENTLKQYRPCKDEAVGFFGECPIADITPMRIKAYISHLQTKQLAPKTIKERYAILKQIFAFAIENEYIEKSPCATIRVKYSRMAERKGRDAASPADEKIIRELKCKSDFEFLAQFLLFTGCRRGEALALSPEDVDFDKKTVKIDKTVIWRGNKPVIKPQPKTTAGEREIPIPDLLVPELEKRKRQKYLFENEDGDLLHNSYVTRKWDALQRSIGISCTPHQLRHSYATMLFDAGIDVKTAQNWLGHKDVKTTLDTYTHLSELRLTQSTDKWTEFVNKLKK